MQKIWFGLFGIIITTGAFAADLCVRNDAMVVALTPYIDGSYGPSNPISKTWQTTFPFGVIYGLGGCHESLCSTDNCIPKNQDIGITTKGNICYCKILRPAESLWVRFRSVNDCETGCQGWCADYVGRSRDLRRALFRSINSTD